MEFGPYLLLACLEGAVLAAVLALMASGLSLVFGVMRVVNVAHGEFYMLGAVMAWVVTSVLGGGAVINFVAALILAPLIVGALAVLADVTILKRLNYDPERTIVATIGLLYIIQQLALMGYGPEARPVEPPFNTRIALPWVEWGEGGISLYFPWGLSTTSYKLFVIAAAVVLLAALRLFMTPAAPG
jgi:branched-chain amino acid transport system permease protein